MPIAHPIINKSIENAQRQVESRNFEIRKHVLEYDDVMNKQREVIYKKRSLVLEESNLNESAIDTIKGSVSSIIDLYINPSEFVENWNLEELGKFIESMFARNLIEAADVQEKLSNERLKVASLKEIVTIEALKAFEEREKQLSPEILIQLEKLVMLNVIDNMWREHLLEMDYLKEGIGLRAYGQLDPLVEYKHEAYTLFKSLIEEIKVDTVKLIFNAKVVVRSADGEEEEVKNISVKNVKATGPSDAVSSSSGDSSKASRPEPVRVVEKIGRNDLCPCGSGKKYKKCCGK